MVNATASPLGTVPASSSGSGLAKTRTEDQNLSSPTKLFNSSAFSILSLAHFTTTL